MVLRLKNRMKNIIALIILFCISCFVQGNEKADNVTTKPYLNQMLADNSSSDNQSEKRCMMVCIEWEQKCVEDATTGKQNCRKVCKEFGEKCF